eukprot:6040719-Pyramimonas_sp.AAC.1
MRRSSPEPRGPVNTALTMPCHGRSCTRGSPTPANRIHNAPPWKLGANLESSFQPTPERMLTGLGRPPG